MLTQKNFIFMLVVLIGSFIVSSFLVSPSDAAVSQNDYDFGDVEVGVTKTTVVSITNPGNTTITISGVLFEKNCGDFNVAAGAAGGTIGPNDTLAVEIVYTPSSPGTCSDKLNIFRADPGIWPRTVSFIGKGVTPDPEAPDFAELEEPDSLEAAAGDLLAQIKDINAFITDSISSGTLKGMGKGKRAKRHLKSFRKEMKKVAHLIKNGKLEKACRKLTKVYKKIDGRCKSKDCVTRGVADELAAAIQALIENLNSV
jgi:ribosomal protein S20